MATLQIRIEAKREDLERITEIATLKAYELTTLLPGGSIIAVTLLEV